MRQGLAPVDKISPLLISGIPVRSVSLEYSYLIRFIALFVTVNQLYFYFGLDLFECRFLMSDHVLLINMIEMER